MTSSFLVLSVRDPKQSADKTNTIVDVCSPVILSGLRVNFQIGEC